MRTALHRHLVRAVSLIVVFCTAVPVFAADRFLPQTAGVRVQSAVPQEIIVAYKKEKIDLRTSAGRASALLLAHDKSLEMHKQLRRSNIAVVTAKDQDIHTVIAELKRDPNIAYAEPNYVRTPVALGTNDTYRDELWALENTGQTITGDQGTVTGIAGADMQAIPAWTMSEGTSTDAIVAVIDSGVAYNHPDLATNMWDGSSCKDENGVSIPGGCHHGYDYADNDTTPLPADSSHGTHVAGIIAAEKNNAKGVAGIAPHAKIMAIRFGFDIASEVQAIDFAIQNGAKVINASFAGDAFSQAEYDAISRFRDAGGVFVAAAGNNGTSNETAHNYPSDYTLDNIISVAATTQRDALASFSDYGPTSVDVGAPGVNIISSIADSLGFSENFEAVSPPALPVSWTEGGTGANWGTIRSSGNTALFADLARPYASNASTHIDSPTIDLSSASGATVSFRATCDTEYITNGWRDYMELFYSGDGSTFVPATDPYYGGDFMWDEAYLNNGIGSSGTASYYFDGVPIPAAYLSNNFKLRFGWVTNATDNNHAGCSVDTITVQRYGDGSDEQYAYYSGTSMATPYVAGIAALLFGTNGTLSSSRVRSVILSSGDTLSALSGKTVTGKRVNAYKALQAIGPSKSITSFSIASSSTTGVIDENAKTILMTFYNGTAVTALVPTISIDGASVSPASGVAQDFTNPVVYTVTAGDGSTQAYTASVRFVPHISTDIVSFDSTSPAVIGTVGTSTVSLVFPFGTDLAAVPISVSLSYGASIVPAAGTSTFVLGVPVVYTVTAEDASTTKEYLVTATYEPDTTPPVITLLGSASVTVGHGATYTDAGATALDAVDGDITSRIVVTNPVNTNVTGTYTVSYDVTDTAGNHAATVTRTVTVNRPSRSGGGGGGGGGGSAVIWQPPVVSPPVLAAATTSSTTMQYQVIVPSAVPRVQSQISPALLTKYLKVGMTDAQVRVLQVFLNTHGYQIAVTGPGSLGQESTYFGQKTLRAVKLFQRAGGLPSTGYVGPMTVAYINKIIAGQ